MDSDEVEEWMELGYLAAQEWFPCGDGDRPKKGYVYFKLPRAHRFHSHAMQVLRGCELIWYMEYSRFSIRLCPRDQSQSELCSEKTIDWKYGRLMEAADKYLKGDGVAVRYDVCGIFSKLIYDVV